MEWQPIETAPKDGTAVDLRIVGGSDWVDFYAGKSAKFNRKTRQREGVTEGWYWTSYHGNPPYWRVVEFPEIMPLSREVNPTHWRPSKQ